MSFDAGKFSRLLNKQYSAPCKKTLFFLAIYVNFVEK